MKNKLILSISITLIILSLLLCIKTAADKREINKYKQGQFSYADFGNGIVDRAEQVYLIAFVYFYGRKTDITIERSVTDMLGELRLHNALYAVGYKRKNTADADLDYDRDRRWYVNFISKII